MLAAAARARPGQGWLGVAVSVRHCSTASPGAALSLLPGPVVQALLTRRTHMPASFDPDTIKGKAALVGEAA